MNDKIEEIITNPLFIPIATGVAGFASGLGLGFFLGKRQKEVLTEEEVHEVAVVDFGVPEEEEVEVTPIAPPIPVVIDEVVAKEKGFVKIDSLADLRTDMVSDEVVDVEEVLEVVEETTDETEEEVPEADDGIPWDWDKELTERLSTAPYILHLEEWTAQELGFSQRALTFYHQDKILVDEDSAPIYNHSNVVGELKFGHGSGQDDVVYIRNHEYKAEYEITRLDQSFAMEIHGLEAEQNARIKDLRHGKVMKFRDN